MIERIRRHRDLIESHTLRERILVFEDEAQQVAIKTQPRVPQPLAAGATRGPIITVQRPQPAAPPNTIQVTIGRVEVRAPAPAATSSAKSRPLPGVKLEEYLRRRGAR
jgi:hypothetical protein